MKKRIKDRWVKALRSGKYKQGQGSLVKQNDKGKDVFCCLGVLCEIRRDVKRRADVFKYRGDISSYDLPIAFRKKIGLSEADQGNLIAMNDNDKASFTKIATYIERNL